MKKNVISIFLLSFLVLAIIGCSSKETSKNEGKTEGYIVDLNEDNQKILVVWNISKKDISNKPVSEILKAVKPDGGAVWFYIQDRTMFNKLKVGKKVEVWAKTEEDSFPGQADADKVEIIK